MESQRLRLLDAVAQEKAKKEERTRRRRADAREIRTRVKGRVVAVRVAMLVLLSVMFFSVGVHFLQTPVIILQPSTAQSRESGRG